MHIFTTLASVGTPKIYHTTHRNTYEFKKNVKKTIDYVLKQNQKYLIINYSKLIKLF